MYLYVHAWGQRDHKRVSNPLDPRNWNYKHLWATTMWELNPGCLEGQTLLLTTEQQPIQSQHYELWMGPLFWKKSQLLLSIFCLGKNTSYLSAEKKI